MDKRETSPSNEELFEQARPVKQRITLLLKDSKVGYTVSIVACSQVMMDICVLGLGLSEQEARRVMADLFITDIVNQ